jgi:hypothetical protein
VKKKRRIPRELTEGLKPRISLLRSDYAEAYVRAKGARDAGIAKKFAALLHLYGVPLGPHCWYDLCLAMAEEGFPGFREKSGRKPKKWTSVVLLMLAGEMRREIDAGASTQELAAQRLASNEPWRGFPIAGRWRDKKDRVPWANLLYRYTRMGSAYRTIGSDAYLMLREKEPCSIGLSEYGTSCASRSGPENNPALKPSG